MAYTVPCDPAVLVPYFQNIPTVKATAASATLLVRANPQRVCLIVGNSTGGLVLVGPGQAFVDGATMRGLPTGTGFTKEYHISIYGSLVQSEWWYVTVGGGQPFLIIESCYTCPQDK